MPATPSAARSTFDLDISVVTAGPDAQAALLLGSTDDGCDTLANGDC
jgi:FxLD family lantipeptide